MIGIPTVFLLIALSSYYYSIAEKYDKNKFRYALLGFFIALFPFILFVLFIVIAHLILGHDPKFKIPKPLGNWSVILYAAFILLFPQYLKIKWKEEQKTLNKE